MQNRVLLADLAATACATVALGTLDVATHIVSPGAHPAPGTVPVVINLLNMGDESATVPRLDVTCSPSGYADSRTNIVVGVGVPVMVTLTPWIYGGGTESCTAWITFPDDVNHSNDTAKLTVTAGIEEGLEMEPQAAMSLTLAPSPLAGNVLRVGYGLSKAGPAKVALFDVSGQVVAARDFIGTQRGELPLDLCHVSGGVYLVRLDDGRSAVTQKLVVQR